MSNEGLTRRMLLSSAWLRVRSRWYLTMRLLGWCGAWVKPPAHPLGTTFERTIVTGTPINAGGYRRLVAGRGEPHLVRHDLGIGARKGRASRRRPLLALAQFTDIHIQDSQSPARVEFLDRLSDGANGNDVWTSTAARLAYSERATGPRKC